MANNKTTAIVIVSLSILASIILIFYHMPIILQAIPGLFIFMVVYYYYEVWKGIRKNEVKEAEAKRQWELEAPKRLKEEKEREERSRRWSLWKPDVDKIINLLRSIRSIEAYIDDGPGDNYEAYNANLGTIGKMEHEIREIGERFYKVEGITILQEVRSYLEEKGEEWFRLGDYWKEINLEFYNETQVAWRKKSR
jgi:hypothetical protein